MERRVTGFPSVSFSFPLYHFSFAASFAPAQKNEDNQNSIDGDIFQSVESEPFLKLRKLGNE